MSIELHPVASSPATAAATTSARENHLLAALLHEAPAEFARVSSALESCDLKAGHVLQNANDLMTEVHFPLSAMASCSTPLSDGEEVMTHFVGNEGVINAESALGSDCSFNKVVVERSGASLRMTAGAWRSAMAESAGLREQILRYLNRQSSLLQRTMACNAVHDVESRFCRQLLQLHDGSRRGVIAATHQALARIMCVRRTTITLIAKGLFDAGIIRYRRGSIEVVDRFALEAAACDCYHDMAAQGATAPGRDVPTGGGRRILAAHDAMPVNSAR